jgi:hypothetical protein
MGYLTRWRMLLGQIDEFSTKNRGRLKLSGQPFQLLALPIERVEIQILSTTWVLQSTEVDTETPVIEASPRGEHLYRRAVWLTVLRDDWQIRELLV